MVVLIKMAFSFFTLITDSKANLQEEGFLYKNKTNINSNCSPCIITFLVQIYSDRNSVVLAQEWNRNRRIKNGTQ